MRMGVRWIGAATAAALLATSMPAMARPRYGYYPPSHGYGHGYGGYGRRHHRDRFDFGDFLLGAVVAGGIVAAVASAKDRDGRPREDRAVAPPRLDGEQKEAANLCADAVERQAGGDARVIDTPAVHRDGDGWQVEGTVTAGDDNNYRDDRRFLCGTRYGRVDFVQIGGELAVR